MKRIDIKKMLLLWALLIGGAQSADAQRGLYFDGINARLAVGATVLHNDIIDLVDERPAGLGADGLDFRFLSSKHRGLNLSAGLGFWFSLPFGLGDGSRYRLDFEGGYGRDLLGTLNVRVGSQGIAGVGEDLEDGSITTGYIQLNHYFHFLDRRALHQPFVGLGVGAYRFDIGYFNEQPDSLPSRWAASLGVEAGYEFRLRPELGIGASYRFSYFWLKKPTNLHRSEIRLTFSYGF